ncbi:MAG: hypothetical protein Tsb009_13170 [Planctomycetaceae bacterium]
MFFSKWTVQTAFLIGMLTIAVSGSGCSQKTDSDNAKSGSDNTAKKKTGSSANTTKKSGPWEGEMKVVSGNWNDLQEIVKSHRGKVVVIDMWATW